MMIMVQSKTETRETRQNQVSGASYIIGRISKGSHGCVKGDVRGTVNNRGNEGIGEICIQWLVTDGLQVVIVRSTDRTKSQDL